MLSREQVERDGQHGPAAARQHNERIAVARFAVADRESVGLDRALGEPLARHQTAANEKRSACSAGTIVSPMSSSERNTSS